MIKEFKNEFAWLSNFTPVQVEFEGLTFHSVENAYQAAKSIDIEVRRVFVSLTPGQSKKHSRAISIREDWEEVKFSIMENLCRQKFNKSPFKEKLLATGNEEIVEGNLWNDKVWGFCLKTGEGQNNLGKIIMKIRSELQDQESKK
ncbi:MAG: NADAR family protein [Chitinophagales bacterium]|nr:NADAR family protein [Chitinophagales bacterium]